MESLLYGTESPAVFLECVLSGPTARDSPKGPLRGATTWFFPFTPTFGRPKSRQKGSAPIAPTSANHRLAKLRIGVDCETNFDSDSACPDYSLHIPLFGIFGVESIGGSLR